MSSAHAQCSALVRPGASGSDEQRSVTRARPMRGLIRSVLNSDARDELPAAAARALGQRVGAGERERVAAALAAKRACADEGARE